MKPRFQQSTDAPVGIAKVVIDCRVLGPEHHGAFKMLSGTLVIAKAVKHPAKAIDDIAVEIKCVLFVE